MTRIDSPSAIRTNAAQRSARCPPSTIHRSGRLRSRPGSGQPIDRPTTSSTITAAHTTSRAGVSTRPPTTTSTDVAPIHGSDF